MVRSKKISTLENIQKAAQELFLERGFSATSVDDICRQAKVTKGGFFHYFKSKECLGKAVLKDFCRQAGQQMHDAGCCEGLKDPLRRVFAALDCIPQMVRSRNKHCGCLITTFIQEMSHSNREFQEICVGGLKEFSKMLKEDLRLAKEKHNPHAAIDINSLADYCIVVVEGAQVLAKASRKPKALEDSINHLKKYLSLVFNSTKSRRVS